VLLSERYCRSTGYIQDTRPGNYGYENEVSAYVVATLSSAAIYEICNQGHWVLKVLLVLYTTAVCDSLVVPSSRRSRGYYPTALVSSLYALLPKPAAKACVYRKVVLSSSLQLMCIPCLRSCVLLTFFNIRGAKSKHLLQHQIVTLTAIRNSLCTFVCA